MSRIISCFVLIVLLMHTTVSNAVAAGTWNGQDTLHVPMGWCAVQGSPAVANPNIAGDTATDALIWRRHERPTDNIYVNPSGITLRSAIQNVWGTLNFPIIADPDTTTGVQGDMRGENVNVNGVEFNALINNCDTAWSGLGYAGIGVTIINANLFHDAAGNYIGIVGWGGCNESPAGTCSAPYDGRVVVVDNNYLFPGVADDTFPPSPADPMGNLIFPAKDPLDVDVGHEVGHALSLDHRTNTTALMNATLTDNNGDGLLDNIGLNTAEVNALRANALNVPGLETDPPGQFNPGRYTVQRMVDMVQEGEVLEFPPYTDLASVRVSLDKEKQRVAVEQQLFGLLPEEGESTDFWYLVDTDGEEQGADPEMLMGIGLPETRFRGADIVAHVKVANRQAVGEAFRFADGELIPLDARFLVELRTLVLYPLFAPLSGEGGELPEDRGYPVHDIVTIDLPNEVVGVDLGKPFRIQTLNVVNGERVVDVLGDAEEGTGAEFALADPSFPHCFPQGDGKPGETVPIGIEGLLANAPIHGLLGPDMVFTGVADEEGGGVIDFPIPSDAMPGYHLVTIGVDDTALTADCVINVVGESAQIDPQVLSLLQKYQELLQNQQDLLLQFGMTINQLSINGNLSDERFADLADGYASLVTMQAELLQQYQDLVSSVMRR